MKKFLLTAALVLALVTSLTAGTMAYYSAQVDTIQAGVANKSFSLTADQTSASLKQNVKIAPGDTVSYEVDVNNASEVRTDVTVAAALSTYYEGMTVTVDYLDGSLGNSGVTDGTDTAKTLMDVNGNGKYKVTVAWDYEDGLTADNGKSATLSIDIDGVQHNDANVIATADTIAD